VATMSYGGEMIGLGQYEKSGKSTGDAGACAHSFETNAQARQLFGDPIVIDEAGIGCDLGSSPDCSSDLAEARFVLGGLNAQIDFACTNGTASIPPAAVTAYQSLGKFLASKPVRALVKHAGIDPRPRLWNNGRWAIEAGPGLPMFDWDPKGNVIELRDLSDDKPNAEFWRDLGIDPKPLTKQRNGYAELEIKIDFAGKLVK
jgi:hypothetical protein